MLAVRVSVGLPEAGGRKPAAAPIGLRPKSVTPACASTSGAGKGDAIIATQKAFLVYRVDFPRENSVGTGCNLGTDLSSKDIIKIKRIIPVRIIE
jgi:hypothetical protein